MIVWEHHIMYPGYDVEADSHDLGLDGWELVAIYPDGRLVYKRLSPRLCIKTPFGTKNVHDLFTEVP